MQHLVCDGVKLAYETASSGEPALLFVHGWACDHSFFAPQYMHFAPRHRVVAVDLRGHGESDAPQQAYTMAGFADDLAWMCGGLGIERAVVVGHSMGGLVTLALASTRPDLVRAAVLVDMSVVLTQAELDVRVRLGEELRAGGLEKARAYAEAMFLPSDDAARRARLVERMLRTPLHVAAACFAGIGGFDMAAAACSCRQPMLYIGASNPRGDARALRELVPQLAIGQMVGSGHFNQLEVPDQVNAMIERFLAVGLADS